MLKRLPTKPGEPAKFRDMKTGEVFTLTDMRELSVDEWSKRQRRDPKERKKKSPN